MAKKVYDQIAAMFSGFYDSICINCLYKSILSHLINFPPPPPPPPQCLQSHCFVFSSKILCSHNALLQPEIEIGSNQLLQNLKFKMLQVTNIRLYKTAGIYCKHNSLIDYITTHSVEDSEKGSTVWLSKK